MHLKRSWFTMLELIIVIGIVLIIMLTMRNMFKTDQRDALYGESCVNKIYGDINNFIYAWITSKSIYTGNTKIYPDNYYITIFPSKNTIELRYSASGSNNVFKSFPLTGQDLKAFYCSTSNYIIQLTGKDTTITINKQQVQDQNIPLFVLSWANSLFSGENIIKICYSTSVCKDLVKLKINSTTQSIRKQTCVQKDTQGNICLVRND